MNENGRSPALTPGVGCLTVLALLIVCTVARAQEPPATLNLQASAGNTSPNFNKYLYTFPISSPAELTGISGSVTITSRGENFAEALFGLRWVAPGDPCPRDGEMYSNYADLTQHYPNLGFIMNLIVKQPSGVRESTIPVHLTFPAGLPVKGRLLVILDGSVLKTGGDFRMSSDLVAHLAPMSTQQPRAQAVGVGDEYCFGQNWGGERATASTAPQAAFMDVVPIKQDEEVLALYGDISDSAFGPAFNGPVGPGPWAISNDYYVYRHCTLPADQSGPADYYATIPPDAVKLDSIVMTGSGQISLQQPIYHPIHGVTLHPGDALVHLIHLTNSSSQGGIDAESQVSALVRPVGKAATK